MSMISRDERKKQKGLKKFINSFSYPIKGLRYAYKNEQNLAFDVGMALIVVIFGFLFKVNKYEWAILVLTIGLVISCELINTAIEAVVDLVTTKEHPLAKIAKDTGSSASLILCAAALICGIIIFVPKILSLF